MAEVCRRAGVHPITMQGTAHRDTRKKMLAWLKQFSGRKVRTVGIDEPSTVPVREQVRLLAAQFQSMYHLEIPRRDDELGDLLIKIELLEAENIRLMEQVSQGRVVRMPGKRRP